MDTDRTGPLLHRDDPDKAPLVSTVKVTRDDWLNMAVDVLISDGVAQVKAINLASRLSVSRSSFYWYFKGRQGLLLALLGYWKKTNTAAMIAQTRAPAETITAAVCDVLRCVIDARIFYNQLDFALHDWSQRSGNVRRVLDQSDLERLDALAAMFVRFDFPPQETNIRARVLYFMQLGYDFADLNESTLERLKQVPMYLYCFTGKKPRAQEIAEFAAYAAEQNQRASE